MLKACLIGCSLSLLVAGRPRRLAMRPTARRSSSAAGLPRRRRTDQPRRPVAAGRDRPHGRRGRGLQVFRIDDPARQGRPGLERRRPSTSISRTRRSFIPKNKMAFPGLKKPEERADVIAYLEQASRASRASVQARELLVELSGLGRGSAALAQRPDPHHPHTRRLGQGDHVARPDQLMGLADDLLVEPDAARATSASARLRLRMNRA